jgi:hypothetical protein
MSVKHCPDCGKQTSSEVEHCTKCDRTLVEGPRPKNFTPVIAERPPYSEA